VACDLVDLRFSRRSAGQALGGCHGAMELGAVVTPGNLAQFAIAA
jgi:hypothetical protein